MNSDLNDIIQNIKNQRDDFVSRCNAAIKILQGGLDPKPSRQPVATRIDQVVTGQKPEHSKGWKTGEAKLIREAVMAQSQSFTTDDIKAYIKANYPNAVATIKPWSYKNTIYQLRKIYRLVEFSPEKKRFGQTVYMLKKNAPPSEQHVDSTV